jgi:aspartate oxidase
MPPENVLKPAHGCENRLASNSLLEALVFRTAHQQTATNFRLSDFLKKGTCLEYRGTQTKRNGPDHT